MLRSRGGRSLTVLLSSSSVPPEISSRPAIMRRIVDLPQPDGPRNTTNSWSATSRLKSGMTSTLPYDLLRFTQLICAMASMLLIGNGDLEFDDARQAGRSLLERTDAVVEGKRARQ